MRKYIIENFILDENQVSFTKINNLTRIDVQIPDYP